MNTTISVIMPVYNSALYLRDALASVAAQTRAPLEVLCIDGPSDDETPSIARAFPRARYLRQTGQGMWNALNEGIMAARGDYLAFLSHDDIWESDKLQRQSEWLDRNPQTDIVFCHARFVLMPGAELPSSFRPELLQGTYPVYMTEALLARRHVFQTLGLFPEQHRISGDIEWFSRMFRSQIPTHMLAQALLTKRFHASNLSTSPSSGRTFHLELLDILRRSIRDQRQTGAAK